MTIVWLLSALALAALAQVPPVADILPFSSAWLTLVAVIILVRWLPAASPEAAAPEQAVLENKPSGRAGRLIDIGALVSLLCSLSLLISWKHCLLPVLFIGPPALLCLGLGLDSWFGFGDPWTSLRGSAGRVAVLLRRRETQVLILILLVGVLFRFISFGDFPPPDGIDSVEEAQAGSGAMQILERGARPWEWPLSWYLAAASFKLFGYSMAALRVPVMILGCLTLVPFYLLVRELTAAPAALFATGLLAVSRWHVQVSWYNDNVFTPLLPAVLVLFLIVRTQRVPRPSLYLLAGALCGYLLYDYAGFRIMPAVVCAFYLGAAWRARGRPRDWRQLAVLAFGFALFAMPLAGIVSRIGIDAYLEAIHRATANKDYYTSDVDSFVRQRLRRAATTIDAFTRTDHEAFLETLNPRGAPLLDPLTGVAFVLGFWTTVLQPRRRYHLFFAVTFMLLTAGATIVVQQLDFRRLAILIPFVFTFVALLADKLDVAAAQRQLRTVFGVALAVVAGLAAAYNFHFLFGVLARDSMVRTFHRDSYTVPAFFLHEHYRGEHVVLVTSEAQNFFLGNDYDWIKPSGLRGQAVTTVDALFPIVPPPPPGRDVLILIEWPLPIADSVERVQAFYPSASCEIRRDPDGPRWPGGPTWDLGVCRIAAAVFSR